MWDADLRRANFTGTNLEGIEIEDNLENIKYEGALFWDTILPSSIAWNIREKRSILLKMTGEEFRERYERGERNFALVDLSEENLAGFNLTEQDGEKWV